MAKTEPKRNQQTNKQKETISIYWSKIWQQHFSRIHLSMAVFRKAMQRTNYLLTGISTKLAAWLHLLSGSLRICSIIHNVNIINFIEL